VIINGDTKLVGDPHLGRKFVTGVPLARLGEREKLVLDEFTEAMNTPNMKTVIIMGDLFHGYIVPPEIILDAFYIIWEAAADGRTIIIVRGNHDAVRDADRKSAFDILATLCEGMENVHVVAEEPKRFKTEHGVYLICPWHPFKSASDVVSESGVAPAVAVFGHWDIMGFGGHNTNLIPLDLLGAISNCIYTGHVHTPSVLRRGDLVVTVVGSLQPYSHDEDPKGRFYIDRRLEELKATEDYTNKCVRLLLKPDEDVPEAFDCLQLTVKRLDAEGKVIDDEKVSLGEFDLSKLFHGVMTDHAVPTATIELVHNKFEELRNGQ
jgi:DNA repair exonuclease SbcCD nuclease subunit